MILYKYLTPERIDVLENLMIRYTQPEALNDPLEGKIVFEEVASDTEMEQTFHGIFAEETIKQYNQLPATIRNLIKLETFIDILNKGESVVCNEFKSAIEVITPYIKRSMSNAFDKTVGVLSLTELPDNMSMWAHYAMDYKGFVIAFDSEHAYFNSQRNGNDEFGYLRKVKYYDNASKLSKNMLELSMDDVFLTKNIEWSHEKEWRILTPLQNADKIIETIMPSVFLFKFPPEALRQVIVGKDMDKENVAKILHIIKSRKYMRHIEIKKAKLNIEKRKLDIIDFQSNEKV